MFLTSCEQAQKRAEKRARLELQASEGGEENKTVGKANKKKVFHSFCLISKNTYSYIVSLPGIL